MVGEDEVRRRLPEVDLLRGNVRSETIRVFVEDVPSWFWFARASEEHHPPDERGLCGTWLHVKRVFVAYTMLERSYRAMSRLTSFQANCMRAAVLLHDGFKYGVEPEEPESDEHPYADGHLSHLPKHTLREHDVMMAAHVREHTDLPEEVAHAIECHGGSPDWYSHSGPRPSDDMSMVVHLADLIASNGEHRMPVWAPADELVQAVGLVPTVSDEWAEQALDL